MARSTPVHAGYSIINGAGTGSNGDRIDVWIEYKVEEQSVEQNRSRVIAYFYAALRSGQSSSTYGGNGCYSSFTVNGVTGSNLKNNGAYDFRVTTPILMGTFNGWITHNAAGAKTINLAGSFTTKSSWISGGNVSGNVTLPTIPRATTPAAPNMTMGTQSAINLSSRASSSFTHTLRYAIGGATGTIVTKTTGTSVNWTPPLALANQITNATKGTLAIYCDTFSGVTLIGTKSVNVSLTVPAGVVPTISGLAVAKQSSNPAVSGWNVFVKGYSAVKLTATASGAYGSSIVSYAFSVKRSGVTVFARTQTGRAWTSGILSASGTAYTFSVTVTDSRGRTATYTTGNNTVYDYSPPSVSLIDVFRCLSGGAKDQANGTYISAKGTFSYASVGRRNTLTKKIEYRKLGAAGWTLGRNNPANNTPYVFGGGGISVASTYEVAFTAQDAVAGAVVYTVRVLPGAVALHVRTGGKGLGIGGAADANELQVYMDADFRGDLKIDGNILIESGVFTPTIGGDTTDGTISYTIQEGYYIRTGKKVSIWLRLAIDVVTVAASGNLRIRGLPYASLNRANMRISGTSIVSGVSWGTNKTQASVYLGPNQTSLLIYGSQSGYSPAVVSGDAVGNGDYFVISMEYPI